MKKEAQDAQWFILKLIGSHLEQLYKQNSFYIKNGEYDKVETPERQEPPKF